MHRTLYRPQSRGQNKRNFLFWELRSILMSTNYYSVLQIGCIPTDVQGVYIESQIPNERLDSSCTLLLLLLLLLF